MPRNIQKNTSKNTPTNTPTNTQERSQLPSESSGQPPSRINLLVRQTHPPVVPALRGQQAAGKMRQARLGRLVRKVKVLVDTQASIAETAPAPGQPRIRRRGNWLYAWLYPYSWFYAISVSSAIALLGVGAWTALQFILKPTPVSWLPAWLPLGERSSPSGNRGTSQALSEPQTLSEIAAELRRTGLEMGKPVYLSTYPGLTQTELGFYDVLLPVLSRPVPCAAMQTASLKKQHCQEIVELRVYRSQSQKFHLLDRMGVVGLTEMAAIAPLVSAGVATGGSLQPLSLSHIEFVEGQRTVAGLWFHLTGDWYRGNETVLYGKLIRYDPVLHQLQPLMNWTSPAVKPPYWQQVTGNSRSELVVDQSIGTEPQFQVYQVALSQQIADRPTLVAIGLTQPAIESSTYKNALLLAENGLWSPALKLLESVKTAENNARAQSGWTSQAQAQLDLVALHAKVTQTQADRPWASPTEQIMTQLMDGRWAKAWQQLQLARKDGYDINTMLVANVDRLLQKIRIAQDIHPGQQDLGRWSTLLQAVLSGTVTRLNSPETPNSVPRSNQSQAYGQSSQSQNRSTGENHSPSDGNPPNRYPDQGNSDGNSKETPDPVPSYREGQLEAGFRAQLDAQQAAQRNAQPTTRPETQHSAGSISPSISPSSPSSPSTLPPSSPSTLPPTLQSTPQPESADRLFVTPQPNIPASPTTRAAEQSPVQTSHPSVP